MYTLLCVPVIIMPDELLRERMKDVDGREKETSDEKRFVM